MHDHVHLLIGMRPVQSLSELMKQVKGDSSSWINKTNLVRGRFNWQEGYGAFSYSKCQLPTVINYIKNQENHHQKKTFRSAYLSMLDEHEVEYEAQYIFQDII